ncbi:MAG: hypothetical protein Q9O24_04070 [Gammaproteobacteria bacterium]|nr:hypothetical protein [Gammaproteobacteria bacterium]
MWKIIVLCSALFFPVASHANSLFNYHFGYGAGLRYGLFSGFVPLLHINKNIDESVVFAEVALSALVYGNVGYMRKVSEHSAISVSLLSGFAITTVFSGHKIGYLYNSNGFNKSGWETSIELYSVDSQIDVADENQPKTEHNWLPSISFGYHW